MTPPKKARYMLVDGHALIHRGYHAMPGLSTKDGKPTGAVYGFSLILLKALADIKPTHIACTFDLPAPTFRHEAYADYKAGRVKAPDALYEQIPLVKEMVTALNIPIFELPGFEADDLLGTLACQIEKKCKGDCEVIIVTGDLDTLQLITDSTRVYTMRKGLTDTAIYDYNAVKERYGGLEVHQLVDYRALRGDASDNIPGVRGIGEKGAIEIIKEFGSIDKLYKLIHKEIKQSGVEISNDKFQIPNEFQISKIKPRILKLLVDQEAQARQSYELSKIKCDVSVKIEIPKYQFSKENFETVFKMFQDLEFKSLVPRLPQNYGQTLEPEKFQRAGDSRGASSAAAEDAPLQKAPGMSIGTQKYVLVDTQHDFDQMVHNLSHEKELTVDTESTGLHPVDSELVGISLCCSQGQAYYVPAKLALKNKDLLLSLLAGSQPKVGHNLKFDLLMLRNAGLDLHPLYFDTMIASYLLNPGTRQHNLEAIAFAELGYHMQPIEELIGKGKKQISMEEVPVDKVAWYAAEDVDITYRLKKIFEPQLKAQKLDKIFYDIEMPLGPVLAAMEREGILVDVKFMNAMAGEAEVEIKKLEEEIKKLAGQEFNINSPKQLKEILFDKLGLYSPDQRKTKTGLSTAADELEKMVDQHPIIAKILEYRELAKLHSTYLLTLPALVSKKTGRLHTNYNQTIAATGRLSSTDPNLQNIPVRGTGMGNRIRRGFVAKPGYKLLSLDYSQIELRIIAHVAQDQKMMDVFNRGEDIHTKTAMEIFDVPADKVTPDMRRDSKTINFGILYGLSSFGLSSRIGNVSRAEAKDFIEKYFAAYPRVKEYIDSIREEVNQKGFVVNQLGRMRRFPEMNQRNWQVRAAAERAAINFPIQSLAADVIKVAMINVYKEISQSNFAKKATPDKSADKQISMLLQVHDELVFEVREDAVEKWVKIIKPIMEEAIQLSVPINVEAKVGDNWGEMEHLKI